MTKGYNLAAKFVIHTVGPIWQGGKHNESALLSACYRNSLQLAADNDLKTIAFPSVSTGVYGYPIEQAARIALTTAINFISQPSSLEEIIFCCFSAEDKNVYQQLLRAKIEK